MNPFSAALVNIFDKKKVTCAYCNAPAKLVGGKAIYPHRVDLYEKYFYQCSPCNAYVGCHPQTTKPLGRLANEELRKAKSATHAAFDPMWKKNKNQRGEKYAWLAKELGITKSECHIGMFDLLTCARTIEICKNFNQKGKQNE